MFYNTTFLKLDFKILFVSILSVFFIKLDWIGNPVYAVRLVFENSFILTLGHFEIIIQNKGLFVGIKVRHDWTVKAKPHRWK